MRCEPAGSPLYACVSAATSQADPDTGEILGCHILGADASTLIQGVANLVRSRLTVDVMRRAIFVHPALPEVVQAAFAQLPVDVGARHGHETSESEPPRDAGDH